MRTLTLADARILAPVVTFLETNGARAEDYLDRFRIPGEIVESGGMVAKKQIHDLLLEVARKERCDEVGFAAYLGFQLSDIGQIGTAMISAKTVKEAFDIFTILAGHAFEGNEYFIRPDGDTTWICFRNSDRVSAGDTYSHHVTMMAYRQMVRLIADNSWRPQQMQCGVAIDSAHARVEGFEDCTASYHADTSALAVPTEFFSRPILSQIDSDEILSATDFVACGDEINSSFADSLTRLIASRFQYRSLPTLNEAAAIVDVSPRTIQRYLMDEGLTYRRLLDRICFDSARKLLSCRQMTIREIALELGYSGTNNFVRSFRRMTGITPAQYRHRHFGT